MSFGKKNNAHNKHSNNDRYLITYADLITLLLGLFVILYASSQVDEKKYKAFAAAFAKYFKQDDPKILREGSGVLQGSKHGLPEPILAPVSSRSISEVHQGLENVLKLYIENGTLQVIREEGKLRIILPEKVLFVSGSADVQHTGYPVLDTISSVLQNVPYQITVDGHSDSDPIRTFQYESNWHLSTARALNVAYALVRDGISEANLIIRGYGDTRPVADNKSIEGKTKNRRVEITVSQLPPEVPSTKGYEVQDTTKAVHK